MFLVYFWESQYDIITKISDTEFLDIILASLPPSYESVMNAWTNSLEEVDKPIEIDSIIRILKTQYNKRKTLLTSQEEQGFMGKSSKKAHICTNCKKQGHLIKPVGKKVVEKKDKVPNRRRDPILRRRREKKGQMQLKKVPVMENWMDQLHSSTSIVQLSSKIAQELL